MGIPCTHAVSCILYNREDPTAYVDPIFKVHKCLQAYSFPIHPLNGSDQWITVDGPELRAPTFPQRKRGPKQTKRRKEAWELETTKVDKNGKKYTALSKKGQVSKCSICSQTGHNRRRHYREV
ncbi:hypothetical protein LINGRAHAP2_LOCUS1809 [Linum grandiflorum]